MFTFGQSSRLSAFIQALSVFIHIMSAILHGFGAKRRTDEDAISTTPSRQGFPCNVRADLFSRFQIVPKYPAGRGSICVSRRHHWGSSRATHARFAAWKPRLRRSSRILCMPISRFTATCVNDADPSNHWSCFVRRAFGEEISTVSAQGDLQINDQPHPEELRAGDASRRMQQVRASILREGRANSAASSG
jgi:hypothetical protein